jgi:hypothetical protein
VSSCVNFFALSNTFSYSKLFHTHWVNPLLRYAEDSFNQNLSSTLWKEMGCTKVSDVQWLLVLLKVATQQIEGKKFIYKIKIRISPICVCVCVWSLLINFPSLICGIWVHCWSHLTKSLVLLWLCVFSSVNERCTVLSLRTIAEIKVLHECFILFHSFRCSWNLPFT